MTGKNDRESVKMLVAGFERYRAIGTREMTVRNIQVEQIDMLHALARVDWRAIYDVGGAQKTIDFVNVYLV